MPNPMRFLSSTGNSTAAVPSPSPLTVDSDVVIILAALLCALICVIGLAVVVRCAWLRRVSGGSIILTIKSQANKGLKKKVIRSLPKKKFNKGDDLKLVDCAICLTEFDSGDEIRILPQCGHGFHLACIDMWLGSHSSCPSCRRILVVPRCQKCGGCPESSNVGGDTETGAKSREDNADRFLP